MAANLQPHHSLPARPPPGTYAAPPARNSNASSRGGGGNAAFGGFAPPSVVVQAPPQASAPAAAYSQPMANAPYPSTANSYYTPYAPATTSGYATPSLTNRTYGSSYDPEEEARIAEWTSAYTRDDSKKQGVPHGNTNATTRTDAPNTPDPDAGASATGKKKTVVREGGGKTWEDASLLEWDPMHPRLFVGNLAGEVTDDSLLKAFSKYPSVSKARVVRDKRTTKSKSYGFVAFSSTDDFFAAAKEMQGKYIGSHPVLIKRATSEVKATMKRDDKHGKNGRNFKNKNKNQNKAQDAGNQAVHPGAVPFRNSGVHKKGKFNGPRLLG